MKSLSSQAYDQNFNNFGMKMMHLFSIPKKFLLTSKRLFTIIKVNNRLLGGGKINTKERILLESLKLFSKYGYDAVSISQIVDKVGITKGAIYKHYKNKEAIFLSILERMEDMDRNMALNFHMPENNYDDDSSEYTNLEISNFKDFTKSMFYYWTHDAFASHFRKILMLEQYRTDEMQSLYQNYLVSGPLSYVKDIFQSIGIEKPLYKAQSFYAMMFMYYSLFDGSDNKTNIINEFNHYVDKFFEEEV